MEAKTKDFDDRLAAETKRRLDELQQKLEKEKEEALAGLKEETAQRLENLQRKYDREHEKMSDGLVKEMVRI